MKKTLIKQRGLLIILVMLILKVIFTISSGYDSVYVIDENQQGYATYINQFKGKLTFAKQKEIDNEYYAVNHATSELEELSRRFIKGEIDKKKYEELSRKNYEGEKNREVFNLVYNQYIYAKEEPTKRYIMDIRGWSSLLSHTSIDFFLIMCLILVFTPLFCYEFESGMNVLLLSSKKGKYKATIYKLIGAFAISVFLTILFSSLEYLCIDRMVGLQNGNYPLKSLEFFKSSEYNISLNQAFLITILNRTLGSLMLALIISIVGILSKKTIITLFTSSVLVFLPYILFSDKSLLYYLPLPSGLLSGTGYLWGTSYMADFGDRGTIIEVVKFQRIDKNIYPFLLLGYFIEVALLFLYCIKRFSGYRLKSKQLDIKQLGIIKLICVFCICSVTLTGCNMTQNVQDNFTYNYEGEQTSLETNGYAISLDIEHGIISSKNLKTGEDIVLTRDPFRKDCKINAIFVRDSWCYYLEGVKGLEGIRIYGIDMKDFSEKLIYNSVKENNENLLGIISGLTETNNELSTVNEIVNCFFLNNEYIYYKRHSTLTRIDRKTGNQTVIAKGIDRGVSCSYYNGDVYFLDNQHRLNIYKEKDKLVHPINSVYTYRFEIIGDKLIFNSLLDNNTIHYYRID